MTHLWWRHVLWSGKEPTLSSTEVGFEEYWDKLWLRLLKGVLPNIEIADELSLLTQSHQKKAKKVKF